MIVIMAKKKPSTVVPLDVKSSPSTLRPLRPGGVVHIGAYRLGLYIDSLKKDSPIPAEQAECLLRWVGVQEARYKRIQGVVTYTLYLTKGFSIQTSSKRAEDAWISALEILKKQLEDTL